VIKYIFSKFGLLMIFKAFLFSLNDDIFILRYMFKIVDYIFVLVEYVIKHVRKYL